MRLLPLLRKSHPQVRLDEVDSDRLAYAIAELVHRNKEHSRSYPARLSDATQELAKMSFADPTASATAHAKLLVDNGWDHARAIVHIIRSKLSGHSEYDNQIGDNTIKRAFRCSVNRLKRLQRRRQADTLTNQEEKQLQLFIATGCVHDTVQHLARSLDIHVA